MTQHQAEIVEEVKRMSKSHPVLSEKKLNRRIERLERMLEFYEAKAPDAPDKQGVMFLGFVSALMYAMAVINMYRKLTSRLAELAEGIEEDDTKVTKTSKGV